MPQKIADRCHVGFLVPTINSNTYTKATITIAKRNDIQTSKVTQPLRWDLGNTSTRTLGYF